MKRKFSPIWRVVVALALVASLGMVFAAPTVANNPDPDGGLCKARAPDFCICTDTELDDDLFIAHGAECISCDTCMMDIDYSEVDHSTPGRYHYWVTCQKGDCIDVAKGHVFVEGCVEVNIIECPGCTDCAEEPRFVDPCTYFGVKAEVINNTGETQHHLEVVLGIVVTGELVGTGDGGTMMFNLACAPIIPGSETVYLDGVVTTGYSIDNNSGVITFFVPPAGGVIITADYITTGAGCGATVLEDNPVTLHMVDPGERNVVGWKVHCEAPGDVELMVSTNWDGCDGKAMDTCTVHQRIPASLEAVINAPCEVCTCCEPENEMVIEVCLTNPGDCGVEGTWVTIANNTPDCATITNPGPRFIEYIGPHSTECVTWNATCDCDNKCDAVFEIDNVIGYDECSGLEVTVSGVGSTATVLQHDVIVDMECVRGLSTEINPDNTYDNPATGVPGTERYYPACMKDCPEMDGTMFDIVSTDPDGDNDQKFQVTTMIFNCTTEEADVTATITLPMCTALADDPVHIYCPGKAPPEDWVYPNTEGVDIDNLCPCCPAYVTWILECTCSTCGSECTCEDIIVEVTGELEGINEPCSPACVIQENKPHLDANMWAIVDDCNACYPYMVDTVAVCQDFDVVIEITNSGEAMAMDVEIDIAVDDMDGTTTCAGTYTDLYIGNIPGILDAPANVVRVLLSDLIEPVCHCEGEGSIRVRMTGMRGIDENTHEPIPVDNIESECPIEIQQCDIEVEIINPEYCEEYCESTTFPVKARITNYGECEFINLCACLWWEEDGKVKLVDEHGKDMEDRCQPVGEYDDMNYCYIIPPAPCPEEPVVYEPIWNVHCKSPGDVTFHVCLMPCPEIDRGIDMCMLPSTEIQIAEINDPPVTIHQMPKPNVRLEIVSPENLDTFVATGQEFSVTAVIANETGTGDRRWGKGPRGGGYWRHEEEFPVTITDLELLLHPEHATILDGPEVPFVIDAGECETVTWTLECDESGLLIMDAYAVAETYECCPVFEAYSFPILVWQYPAAHLEVQTLTASKDPVTVCETFTVSADIVNTGEADATEVEATLSVIPEDSAHITDDGYTKYIGTLPGHGQDGTESVSWTVHCKKDCDTTFNVTAEGADEYGWHKKQECQSTGNFIIEAGGLLTEELPGPMIVDGDGIPVKGVQVAIFVGEASGLIGPFNFNTPISWVDFGDYDSTGNMTGFGFVIPDMDFVEAGNHVEFLLRILPRDINLIDLLEWLNMQGVDKDVMVYVGHMLMDSEYEDVPYGYCNVVGGLIQVINGHFTGTSLELTRDGDDGVFSWLDGEYCSTMAQEALRPIQERFIEDASVTVKQVIPAQLVVEIDFPDDGAQFDRSDDFPVTAIITNIGEETADGVHAVLTVDEYATITDPDHDLGDITGGASVDTTWDVHCDDPGFSVFKATATGTGNISTNPVEAFDTVTVEQGEMPAAQLVVDISYPENGDEFIVGDEFVVTATIENLGERTAENVGVTLDISANASEVSGPTGGWPKNISPTSSAVATWTVECTAVGFSVITVTAAGTNTNSAVDPVTVKQIPEPAPYLVVEVSAPVEVVEGDSFFVTAVVSNIGDADADSVDATTTVSGPASPPTETKSIGTIDAGDSATKEFELTCTGEGGVNVAVSAEGTDTNVAADSAAVEQIAAPEDTTDPMVWVYVPNGGEVWQGGTQQAITWYAIDDVTAQEDLVIDIHYSINGGTSWSVVVLGTENDGAYKWDIPADINSSQCLIKVTATDEALNSGFDISLAEFTIYTPPEWVEEYDISLDEGWNLISLPLIPFDTDIEDVLLGVPAGSVDIVWAYDALTETWLFYDPDTTVGDLAEMKDGLGYWMLLRYATTLTIYGTPMPAPGPTPPPAYDVYEGWNLSGYKSLGPMAHNTYLYNIVGDYTVIWGYDDGEWFLVFPSPPGVGGLMTGLGYYIWMTTDGVIIPPGL